MTVDRRRLAPVEQAIAPVAQLAEGQQSDRAGQQRGGDQLADHGRVGDQTAARRQIALVGVERILHGGRAITGILAANENAGFVLRLPECADGRAVGGLVIVGERDGIGPVRAMTIGGA